MSVIEGIRITIIDVHPPLYYEIPKLVVSFLGAVGILTVVMTVAILATLLVTYKPIYQDRYVLPVIVLLWFAVSVFISKLDFRKVAVPLLVIFLIAGVFNVCDQLEIMHDDYDESVRAMGKLSDINQPGNIVVIEGMQKYMRFNEYLNETTIYTNFHINNMTKNLDYTEILGLDNTTFIVPDDIGNHTVYFICDKKTGYMGHPEDFRVIKSERVLNSKIFRIANE